MQFRKKTIQDKHMIFSKQVSLWKVDINPDGVAVPLGLNRYLISHGLHHMFVLEQYDRARDRIHDPYFFAFLIDFLPLYLDSYKYWRVIGVREDTLVRYEADIQKMLCEPSAGNLWTADMIAEWTKDMGWTQLSLFIYEQLIEACKDTFDAHSPYMIELHFHLAHLFLLMMEYEKGLSVTTKYLERITDHYEIQSDIYIDMLGTHALLLHEGGNPEDALPYLRKAHQYYVDTYGSVGEQAFKSHVNLVSCYTDLGLWEECEHHFSTLFSILEQNENIQEKYEFHVRSRYASFLMHTYQYEQAQKEYESLLHGHLLKYGKEHPQTLLVLHYYMAFIMQSYSYHLLDEVEPVILDCISNDRIKNAGLKLKLRYALLMGKISRNENRDAEESLFALLEDSIAHFGKEHMFTCNVMQGLASILTKQQEIEEALQLYEHIWKYKSESKLTADIAYLAFEYGWCLRRAAAFEESESFLQRSIELYRRLYAEEHPSFIEPIFELAELYAQQEKTELAQEHYRTALRISDNSFGETAIQSLVLRGSVAMCFTYLPDSLSQAREISSLLRRIELPHHMDSCSIYFQLGRIELESGQLDSAKEYAHKGIELSIQIVGENNVYDVDLFFLLYQIFVQEQNWEDAIYWLKRAEKAAVSFYGAIDSKTHQIIAEYEFIYPKAQRYDEHLIFLEQYLPLYIEHFGLNHSFVMTFQMDQSQALFHVQRYEEAMSILKQIQERLSEQNAPKKLWVVEHRILYQLRERGEPIERNELLSLERQAIALFGEESRPAKQARRWVQDHKDEG